MAIESKGADAPALLLLGGAVLLSSLFWYMSFRTLLATGPIWVEGPMIGIMTAIRDGRLYQMEALANQPYIVLTHTPLSYWLSYPFYASLPGLQSLRAVNILLVIGCAALIAMIVRSCGGRWMAQVFAAIVFVLAPPVFLWSQIARSCDSLSALFSCASLLAWMRMQSGWRRDLVLAMLFSGAVLSKQTALAILGTTLFLAYATSRDFRGAARWVLASFAILGLAVAALQHQSHGGFLVNVVTANLIPFSLDQGFRMTWIALWPLWLMTAALVASRRNYRSPIWFYFGSACVFGLVTVSKVGADTNYFFDLSVALALMAGSVFVTLSSMPDARRRWGIAAAVGASLCLMVRYGDRPQLAINRPAYSAHFERMTAFLRAAGCEARELLSEDAWLNLRLASRPVWNDPLVFGAMAKQNAWRSERIVQAASQRQYCAVVLRARSYLPPNLMSAITDNYSLVATFPQPVGEYQIFLPR